MLWVSLGTEFREMSLRIRVLITRIRNNDSYSILTTRIRDNGSYRVLITTIQNNGSYIHKEVAEMIKSRPLFSLFHTIMNSFCIVFHHIVI